MLSEVVGFVIRGMGECFNLTKSFILDKIGNANITYFHFLLFGIFMTIVIRLIGFIKGIQEVEDEKENQVTKRAYNEWSRDHPSTPRRRK